MSEEVHSANQPSDWQPLNDDRSRFQCGPYQIAKRDDGSWESVNQAWFGTNTTIPCWPWKHPPADESTILRAASEALTADIRPGQEIVNPQGGIEATAGTEALDQTAKTFNLPPRTWNKINDDR